VEEKADPMPRSVILDTATETYELGVLEEFGKTDQISPESRRNRMGPVNTRYKGLVRALADTGINVLLLHRVKRKWETREVRGRGQVVEQREEMTGPWDYERVGFNQTGNICSCEVFVKHDPARAEKLSGQFGMYIARTTIRPSLIGRDYWGRIDG